LWEATIPPLTPTERALTERLDEANETIRQLRAEVLVVPACRYRGFSPCESGVLSLLSLVPGRVHAAERLSVHLGGISNVHRGGGVTSPRVTVSKVRAKLRRLAPLATIETHGWSGYSMTAESIAVMDGLLLA
jgi:DNA-binding response OmpR family regulator